MDNLASKIKELKKQAQHLEPVLRIGKNGITDNVYTEFEKLFNKRELVKVKFLSSFADLFDVKEVVAEVSKKTSSLIISRVGNSVVFYKKMKNRAAEKKVDYKRSYVNAKRNSMKFNDYDDDFFKSNSQKYNPKSNSKLKTNKYNRD